MNFDAAGPVASRFAGSRTFYSVELSCYSSVVVDARRSTRARAEFDDLAISVSK